MKAALILAGGKAARFNGAQKAFLPLCGKPLIQWVLDAVSFCDEIVISGNSDLNTFGYPVVEDKISGIGPLAGFQAGFSEIKAEYTFVTGCDMPFLNQKVIYYLFEKAQLYSCALPKKREYIEPLCCVYNTQDVITCLSSVITAGTHRLFTLVKCLPRPRFISFEDIQRIDPGLKSFKNINTPHDLHCAQEILHD
ncbi:MAG: molybdenum cofactor guanylyltransferase [Candidatus Methanofastidiosia archaeon]|jgi:molybdopterin-guanine dinucleotide biosynthesis protein A